MKRFFVIVFCIALATSSCHFMGGDRIRGNGAIKTETRNAASFSSVDVSGNIQVFVKQDSAFAVRIETDENLMEHIVVRTSGETLVIEPKDHANLSSKNDIKVYVSAPVFRSLEASGASGITSESLLSAEAIDIDLSGASHAKLELRSPKVAAEISGASSVLLKGQTRDLTIDGQGASHARCYDLLSENATVEVSGASSAQVFASVKLSADASGASSVKYKGAASHSGNASGASSISKVE
jgi:hypothetical protein